ncbi:ABC transporter ATP-binding protein [Streptomyces sp. KR80]|uniref:ABC transporter ATP-binding protein n=1 Tax=Streptomyces sp. KR80 TaxID=3457426 RepID=UPI003FD52B3C
MLEEVGKDVVLRDGQPLTLLDQVNLTVRAGEFVAVVGRSGSGKSTLLNLIGLLDTPTRGRILYEDKDISGCGDTELSQLRGQHLGFVFQQFNLLARRTAVANVAAPLLFTSSCDARERRRRAVEQLRRVGLEHRLDAVPSTMSGGEQQRVAIARALIGNPKIVLADEPTGSLDEDTGTQVMRLLIDEVRSAGATLLLVTHDRELALQADRTVHLDKGRVLE